MWSVIFICPTVIVFSITLKFAVIYVILKCCRLHTTRRGLLQYNSTMQYVRSTLQLESAGLARIVGQVLRSIGHSIVTSPPCWCSVIVITSSHKPLPLRHCASTVYHLLSNSHLLTQRNSTVYTEPLRKPFLVLIYYM